MRDFNLDWLTLPDAYMAPSVHGGPVPLTDCSPAGGEPGSSCGGCGGTPTSTCASAGTNPYGSSCDTGSLISAVCNPTGTSLNQ